MKTWMQYRLYPQGLKHPACAIVEALRYGHRGCGCPVRFAEWDLFIICFRKMFQFPQGHPAEASISETLVVFIVQERRRMCGPLIFGKAVRLAARWSILFCCKFVPHTLRISVSCRYLTVQVIRPNLLPPSKVVGSAERRRGEALLFVRAADSFAHVVPGAL